MLRPSSMFGRSLGPVPAVISALVVFAHAARFAFVYDDHWTIEHNRWLALPIGLTLSLVLAGRAAQSGIPDATRPSMALSTWVDHRLFGLSPVAFHVHSLLLYLLVVVLAWRVLLLVTGRPRTALAGSLFFAVAPVHAEVVAAINYREDLLAAVGVLLPTMALLRRRDRPVSTLEASALAAAWVFGLCAKESALVLPLLLAVAMLVRRVDLAWLRAREKAFLALGASLLVWGNWRVALLLRGDDLPRAAPSGAIERLCATARFEVLALVRSLVPVFWSPEHASTAARPASWFWGLLLVVIVVACVALARRRSARLYALGLAFALVAPLASSPLARPVNTFADRYLFLSVLGGAIVFGAAWDHLSRRVGLAASVGTLAVSALAMGGMAWQASRAWRTDATLWTAAAERAPESPRAWTGLARVRRLEGALDAADEAVARALSLDEHYLPARLTAAYNRLARGDVDDATEILTDVINRGGGALGGVARARRCLELPPERARRCASTSP